MSSLTSMKYFAARGVECTPFGSPTRDTAPSYRLPSSGRAISSMTMSSKRAPSRDRSVSRSVPTHALTLRMDNGPTEDVVRE